MYNNTHMHSGLKFITPSERHRRDDMKIMQKRHEVYQAAKNTHPARWSGNTRNWRLPNTVSLNANRKNLFNPDIQKEDKKQAA